MDDWEKFNKTILLEKEGFYRDLNMEDIRDCRLNAWKKSLQRL